MDVKKILAFIMIMMIIVLGISIERDITVVDRTNPYDKYINYNMAVNPDNLKLTDDTSTREKDLLVNLFQGLVKEDEDGEIVGALAEKWERSEDGLGYSFYIRKDIHYSSGEKITAEDFVDFFQSFLNDDNNIYRSDLDFIYGAKDYREGKSDFSQVAIYAKDDILTIRLNYPCSYFLNILTHPVYALRDYNNLNDYKKSYKQIRYTGPFVIEDVFEGYIVLSKNEKYYKAGEVTDDEIRISFIDSAANALAIFEDEENKTKNKVDVMLDVPVNEIYRLSKMGIIKEFEGNQTLILNFNEDENKAASTTAFRTAINDSLDREKCSEIVSNNLLIPVYSAMASEEEAVEVFKSQWKSDVKKYFNDMKEADNLKIKMVYEDKSLQRRVAKELCEELTNETKKVSDETKELSDETKVEFIPLGYSDEELQKVLEAGEYDIYLGVFQFKYDSNFEYFNDIDMDSEQSYRDIINSAKNNMNEKEREAQFAQCEQILFEQLSPIPLYKVNNIVCYKKEYNGFYVSKRGNIYLEEIERVR